ncbi:MAG: phytoene desaturase family protein [Gaiellaceae bacterium]
MTSIPDAVIIGAGHNGLVAANVLADAGWSVSVVEAEDEPGGCVRSGELIEPGFVHDRFSAFFPLAVASPVFRALELDLPFRHGPLVLAHPALDGSCAVLAREEPWEQLAAVWARLEPAVLRGMITPFPQVRALAEAVPALLAARAVRVQDELRQRLVLGNTLHSDLPPRSRAGRSFGLLLTAFAQRYGYPCIEGGAGKITDALVSRALARGVDLRLGERVERLPRARRAVLAAVDVWTLGRIAGRSFGIPPDPATVKVDWTLDGPVPWAAEEARRSCVVHLGDDRSFVLFGQYSMADPTRSPVGKETAWAYSHVLRDADAIEAQVERHAPGFRALIRGRHVLHLPPGRVNGGTARRQILLRPRFGRPKIADGLYLASMSAHPGGGVHGAPGWIAAQAALRSASRHRARGLVRVRS